MTDTTPSLDQRRAAFGGFVRRALTDAHTGRGWSIPRVAAEAGIANPTLYRWRAGDWRRSPQPEQVVAFCDTLDIPAAEAFVILWPGKTAASRGAVPPPELPAELTILAHKLNDPAVPDIEKYLLRESLAQLAARPNAGGATPGSRRHSWTRPNKPRS